MFLLFDGTTRLVTVCHASQTCETSVNQRLSRCHGCHRPFSRCRGGIPRNNSRSPISHPTFVLPLSEATSAFPLQREAKRANAIGAFEIGEAKPRPREARRAQERLTKSGRRDLNGGEIPSINIQAPGSFKLQTSKFKTRISTNLHEGNGEEKFQASNLLQKTRDSTPLFKRLIRVPLSVAQVEFIFCVNSSQTSLSSVR